MLSAACTQQLDHTKGDIQAMGIDKAASRATAIIGLFLAAGLIAACSGPVSNEASDAAGEPEAIATEAAAEPEIVSTPEPQPAILADAWTDGDGYTFEFELTSATPTVKKDIANAKPGEAIIVWEYEFTGELANTTLGRNADAPYIGVQPVWPADSAACKIAVPGTVQWSSMEHAFSYPASDDEDKWCTVALAPFSLGANDVVPPDTTIIVSGGGQSATMTEITVPEAEADATIAALSAPYAWALVRKSGPQDNGACSADSGTKYVSKVSADTGCGV